MAAGKGFYTLHTDKIYIDKITGMLYHATYQAPNPADLELIDLGVYRTIGIPILLSRAKKGWTIVIKQKRASNIFVPVTDEEFNTIIVNMTLKKLEQ